MARHVVFYIFFSVVCTLGLNSLVHTDAGQFEFEASAAVVLVMALLVDFFIAIAAGIFCKKRKAKTFFAVLFITMAIDILFAANADRWSFLYAL